MMDPIKFRVLRILKFRLKVQQAQRSGQPVPVNTPELEAIGVMTDMLSLMYRFSVDTLGGIISPVTILVLYLFREEFEISTLYGMRSTDLTFFMLFSFFLIPALSVARATHTVPSHTVHFPLHCPCTVPRRTAHPNAPCVATHPVHRVWRLQVRRRHLPLQPRGAAVELEALRVHRLLQ